MAKGVSMVKREFLKWLCAITGGYFAISLSPPLRRINTTLFSSAHALEPCTEDTCTTRDNCGSGDTLGHTCEVRDVCDADVSGNCKNDECEADSSGDCEGDSCRADSSGDCTGDSCVSDNSGACTNDECVSDSSGACIGDTCISDASGACVSDNCSADKSGDCNTDTCVSDKSGQCTNDECVSDSSGDCNNDKCTSDKTGKCTSDECVSDASGECNNDRCVTDQSGACRQIDVCVLDLSNSCGMDLCREDRNPDDCTTSDTCSLDHVLSRGISRRQLARAGVNRAIKWLYHLSAILLFITAAWGLCHAETVIDISSAVFYPKPTSLTSQPVSIVSPVGPFLRDCDNDGILEADTNGDGRCEGDPKVMDYRGIGTRELPAGTPFTGRFEFTCFHVPSDVSITSTGPITIKASHRVAVFGSLRLSSGVEISSLGIIDNRTSAWLSEAGDIAFRTALSGEVKEDSPIPENWNRMPSETISPSEGSLGTIVTIKGYCHFGSKKGKVLVGGTAVKVTEWTTDSITGLISKVPKAGPGNCDVLVVAKEPKGVLPLSRKGAFTVKAPEITTLDPHGAALTEVTLDGNFFGTKKGKVVLEIGGKLKSCKVVEWWMEAATGESRVKFLVPKGIIAGTYPLKMINKVETGETQFKID